jgi:hypothetical protein
MYQFHTELLGTIRASRTRCTTQIGYNVLSITWLPPSLGINKTEIESTSSMYAYINFHCTFDTLYCVRGSNP